MITHVAAAVAESAGIRIALRQPGVLYGASGNWCRCLAFGFGPCRQPAALAKKGPVWCWLTLSWVAYAQIFDAVPAYRNGETTIHKCHVD